MVARRVFGRRGRVWGTWHRVVHQSDTAALVSALEEGATLMRTRVADIAGLNGCRALGVCHEA